MNIHLGNISEYNNIFDVLIFQENNLFLLVNELVTYQTCLYLIENM